MLAFLFSNPAPEEGMITLNNGWVVLNIDNKFFVYKIKFFIGYICKEPTCVFVYNALYDDQNILVMITVLNNKYDSVIITSDNYSIMYFIMRIEDKDLYKKSFKEFNI